MSRLLSVIILLSLCAVNTTCAANKVLEGYELGVAESSDSKIILSTMLNEINGKDVILCEYNLTRIKKCQTLISSNWMKLDPSDAVINVKTGDEPNKFEYNSKTPVKISPSIFLALIVPKVKSIEINSSHSLPQAIMSVRTEKGKVNVLMCTSTEGVHILSSELNQHLYMYLGYEISPNCAESVYE